MDNSHLLIVFKGPLLLHGNYCCTSWKTKYFQLTTSSLLYYHNENMTSVIRDIPLDQTEVLSLKEDAVNNKHHIFLIRLNGGEEILLGASNDASRDQWLLSFKSAYLQRADYLTHILQQSVSRIDRALKIRPLDDKRAAPSVKCGTLKKRGHGGVFVKSNHSRHFVLMEGKLSYFERPSNDPPYGEAERGSGVLNGATVTIVTGDDSTLGKAGGGDCTLRVMFGAGCFANEDLILAAENVLSRDSWMAAILDHIHFASGSNNIRSANVATANISVNNNSQSVSLCVVCLTNDATHAISPCGHKCICGEHATKLKDCPICRLPIKDIIQIFSS